MNERDRGRDGEDKDGIGKNGIGKNGIDKDGVEGRQNDRDKVALLGRISTLERWQPVGDPDDAWVHVLTRVRRRRRMRQAGVGTVAACVVVLAVLFARTPADTALVVSDPDPDSTPTEEPQPVPGEVIGEPVDVSVLTESGSHDLGPWPMSARDTPAVTWTGSVLFAWGGQVQSSLYEPTVVLDDGAVFDLAAGQWVRVSEAPFPSGLYQPTAAWDGTEVIVVGLQCGPTFAPLVPAGYSDECPQGPVAAAWNPSTNTWRTIPAPPFAPMGWVAGIDGGAAFVSADSPAGRVASWSATTQSWSQRSGPLPGGGGERQMQAINCSGSGGVGVVATEPAGSDPGGATWARSLDAESGIWSEPIEVGHQVDHPVACTPEFAVVEVSVGAGGDVVAGDPSRVDPPQGVPGNVFDLLQETDLMLVHLATGEVTRIDDGPTFGYTWALGDWIVVDRVDESTLADKLSPDPGDGSQVPTAPLPDTQPFIGRLAITDERGDPSVTELVPVGPEDSILHDDNLPGDGAWTGEVWLGRQIPDRKVSEPEPMLDPRFVAWVPPHGP